MKVSKLGHRDVWGRRSVSTTRSLHPNIVVVKDRYRRRVSPGRPVVTKCSAVFWSPPFISLAKSFDVQTVIVTVDCAIFDCYVCVVVYFPFIIFFASVLH